PPTPSSLSFFLHDPPPPPALHSFPTRRSSDLHERHRLEPSECERAHQVEIAGGLGEHQAAGVERSGARRSQRRVDRIVDDELELDRKSTRLNSSHLGISYAVFCLKKKKKKKNH